QLTGDPELALSNAFARVVEQQAAPVSSTDILAAERSIIAARFRGSRSGYLSAIAQAHTSLSVARGVIGDELRHARIESRFRVSAPSGREIADYQDSYGDLNARRGRTKGRVQRLGGHGAGCARAAARTPQRMNGPVGSRSP